MGAPLYGVFENRAKQWYTLYPLPTFGVALACFEVIHVLDDGMWMLLLYFWCSPMFVVPVLKDKGYVSMLVQGELPRLLHPSIGFLHHRIPFLPLEGLVAMYFFSTAALIPENTAHHTFLSYHSASRVVVQMPHLLYTGLEDFKVRGPRAAPFFAVTHYTELARSKELVLVRGDVVLPSQLSDDEVSTLVLFSAFCIKQYAIDHFDVGVISCL